MICRRRKLLNLIGGLLALALTCFNRESRADGVILHLRNGDRIAGTLLSQTTNEVKMSTVWANELVIPVAEIERREVFTNKPGTISVTNTPAPASIAAKTNGLVTSTNTVAAVTTPSPLVTAPSPPPPQLPWYKHWKGELLVGSDYLRGVTDHQIYYGKASLTYSHAYASDPKEFFRNILTYAADYGKTDGLLSANDMLGSSKTDFDLSRRIYIYNLGSAGYDEVQKINLHYEEGPGAGYHLFRGTNFLVNVELGGNYQVQERSDDTTTRNFFYRVAEDITWKLNKQMTLTEKFEFSPRSDLKEYRSRFESTLSYALMLNLSLNMAVINTYDSQPALGVPNNELQFRTSLGVKF